jgi:hypothetical protein
VKLKVLFDPATGENSVVNARNGDIVEDVQLTKEATAVLHAAVQPFTKHKVISIQLAELSVSLGAVEVVLGPIAKPEVAK